MQKASQIEARSIGKTFGTFTALDDISLSVERGEFLSLLGPSGSGKTTFLTVLAGFLEPSAGRLYLEGRDVTKLPAGQRGFGMVFQGYALFPHLSVADNIAFPLKVQKRSAAQIRARVAEMIELVGLAGHGHKKPASLSGGQQQRVALARALAYEPPVLLLDEPFSALDKNLRGQMQDELRRLHRELGTTFVFVTHDQSEALALSSHVAIFDHGKLQQIGAPDDIYERPANRFVAEFLGDINILPLDAGSPAPHIEGQPVALPADARADCGHLAIRPEHMRLTETAQGCNSLRLRVADRIYQGAMTRLILHSAAGSPVTLHLANSQLPEGLATGQHVHVSWETQNSFPL
ncbi:ABC transporter ATP-binding protein [Thioclava sp. BHET1]|nr:ABC transporter ATP-binding protein [Thioclava sp. BHET1]